MKALLSRRAHGRFRVLLFLLILAASVMAARGAGADEERLFRAGTMRMSVHAGGGTAFDLNYSIIGIGIGYFVVDRLEAGIKAESWQGSGPDISRISPQVTYIFASAAGVRPYLGAFYTRTSIEGFDDQNAAGGRAGALFFAGGRAYFGAGAVHEVHLNCNRAVYASCSDTNLELLAAVLF